MLKRYNLHICRIILCYLCLVYVLASWVTLVSIRSVLFLFALRLVVCFGNRNIYLPGANYLFS